MRRFIIFFAIVSLGCLAGAQAASAAKRGGTLRIAIEGNVEHLDGTTALGIPIKFYRDVMGSSLLQLDENYKLVGDLAHKWDVSDEGRVITFHLHKGAKFHDGTDMDAEAVKWNIEVLTGRLDPAWLKELKEKNPGATLNSSYSQYLLQIKRVEVVDKHTVRFHQSDLGKGMTLAALGGYWNRPVLVSPTAYDKDIQRFRNHPIHGGPFKVAEYKPNQHLIMERFKDYFIKDRPYLDRIEAYVIPDANQRMNALKSGEIDMILNVPKGIVKTLQATPGVTVQVERGMTTFAAMINSQRPVWKDVRVRRAIGCYAINRKQIVDTALRGLTVPWNSYVGPGSADALDLRAECPYDPEKAKQLLAEAGYGPANPFKFTMTINNTDPAFVEISQILKSMFAQAGAQMEIQILDRAAWVSAWIRRRSVDMVLQDSLPALEINSIAQIWYGKSPLNYLGMQDADLDRMLEEWRSTLDTKKQIDLSHQMQRRMVAMGYFPAFAGSPFFQAMRDYVKGNHNRGKLYFDMRDVWLDK
ncbi:MAG: ABC transporter substrate-binding protein [Nitrospinota bacterium]